MAVHGDAQGGQGGTTHTPAQLVELGEPEMLSIKDHHEGRIGDIHADLNDDRGHQERGAPSRKIFHDLRLERGRSAPRQLRMATARKRGVGTQVSGDLLDRR